MLDSVIAMPVLAASDLTRARTFWHDCLGRDPVHTDERGDVYNVGGVAVLVYESAYAGTARSTTMALMTDDLERDMVAMRERGVVFHDYDLPGVKTVDGVMEVEGERVAWFSDSEGNTIAIEEPAPGRLERVKQMRSVISG